MKKHLFTIENVDEEVNITTISESRLSVCYYSFKSHTDIQESLKEQNALVSDQILYYINSLHMCYQIAFFFKTSLFVHVYFYTILLYKHMTCT